MNTLTGLISHVPAPAAYAILAATVLAESLLLIGALVPTLTLLLTAGALARTGDLNLVLIVATAASAVVAGDALGHRTGRLLGSRPTSGRLGRRIPSAAWRRAEALMAVRGGQAVFLCRFVSVLRTLAPHLAGAARLPYRRIAPYSLLAAPLWAGAEATTGYAAATSLQHVITVGGSALVAVAALVAVLVAGGVLAAVRIRGGSRRNTEEPHDHPSPQPPDRSGRRDLPGTYRACAGAGPRRRPSVPRDRSPRVAADDTALAAHGLVADGDVLRPCPRRRGRLPRAAARLRRVRR